MGAKKNPKDLAKLLAYALGRRPYEFGLVPDTEGYVRIKTLLQALGEEAGWKYVRENHLREVLLSVSDPPVEMVESRIRARHRDRLPKAAYEPSPPGLLYHCVRRRAWPHVRQKGLKPGGEAQVCLTADPEAAVRRGRRIDPEPVLVTVHTTGALDLGVVFSRFGPGFFLVEEVPAACITGPPLPKTKEEPAKAKPAPAVTVKTPGSFLLDLTGKRKDRPSKAGKRRKKDPDWKRERRRNPK
jgi:putative RNA 2'-phosphotransferase